MKKKGLSTKARASWGVVNPVTRVMPSRRAYYRARDKFRIKYFE